MGFDDATPTRTAAAKSTRGAVIAEAQSEGHRGPGRESVDQELVAQDKFTAGVVGPVADERRR